MTSTPSLCEIRQASLQLISPKPGNQNFQKDKMNEEEYVCFLGRLFVLFLNLKREVIKVESAYK